MPEGGASQREPLSEGALSPTTLPPWPNKGHTLGQRVGWLLKCISQGSPEELNQQEVCIIREIYFKELAHLVVEAWQVQNPEVIG